MGCNGICKRYKAVKRKNQSWYENNKRCSGCEIYIKWDGLLCPCCNNQLRTGPKNKKYKEQLRMMKAI